MLPFVLNGEYIIDAVKAVLRNNSIDIYHADGSINTYSYIDSNTAAGFYTAVKLSQTTATGIVIAYITPVTFDITSTQVVIHGLNFPQSDTLQLRIEDTFGGLDSNGYFMNCAWQDSSTLYGTFGGAGDSSLSAQNYVYLLDTTPSPTNRSNALTASWPGSGTIVTMQQ